MWLYYWGMTERQVDLLLADQPLVVYNHDKKPSGGKKGKNAPEFSKASEGDVMQSIARFSEKHGVNGDGKVNLDLKNMFGK